MPDHQHLRADSGPDSLLLRLGERQLRSFLSPTDRFAGVDRQPSGLSMDSALSFSAISRSASD
jgi:hypothetical protein